MLIALCATVWPKRRLVRALGIAIASVALLSLTTSCSTSRKASEVSNSVLATDYTNLTDKHDSVLVIIRDTLREVTTITIRENEQGDTLRVSTVTDRDRLRSRENLRRVETVTVTRIDTVYIQKDSVSVEDKKIGLSASTDGRAFGKRAGLLTYVKWITALVCAIVVLVVVIKVCLLRR